jgi:hypothetical protein
MLASCRYLLSLSWTAGVSFNNMHGVHQYSNLSTLPSACPLSFFLKFDPGHFSTNFLLSGAFFLLLPAFLHYYKSASITPAGFSDKSRICFYTFSGYIVFEKFTLKSQLLGIGIKADAAGIGIRHLNLVPEHSDTSLDPLIPVLERFRHRHSFSFRYRTDRMIRHF